MNRLSSIVLILSCGIALSCMNKSKPLPQEFSQYIGQWSGPDNSSIVINADGTGSLEFNNSQGGSTMSKTANPANVIITGDTAIIFEAIMGITMNLRVDEKPAERENGAWSMTVDGLTFTK